MSPGAPSRERGLLALLALAGLVAATHAQLLGFEFVYDDRWTVVNNAYTAHPANLAGLADGSAFAEGVVDAERPVALATVFLDRALFGLSPRGHHLQSLLWHLLATLLLGLLVLRAFGERPLAWLTAGFFAILPAHAEAVAVVSYREDLIAAAFSFAALAALQRRGSAWAAAPLLFFGFLGKESAGGALLMWPLLVWMRGEPNRAPGERPASLLCGLGLLAAGVGLALGLRMAWAGEIGWAPAASVRVPERGGLLASAAAAAQVALTQLAQLFVPLGLGPEHPDPPPAWPGPLVALGAAGLFAALLAARRAGAERRAIGAALLALAGLAPLLAPWRLPNLWADRFLYLPSAGASLLLAHLVSRHGLASRGRQLATGALVAALLLAHSVAEQRYHDEQVLWSRAARIAPGSPRTWLGLGAVRLQRGDLQGAGEAAARGRLLSPESPGLLRLEAMIACHGLRRREAWALFEDAERQAGRDAGQAARPAWKQVQRAACALELREFDRAREHARRAQALDRFSADAHALEGLALQRLGDLRGAHAALHRALATDPHRGDLRRWLSLLHEEAGGLLADAPLEAP